MANNRLREAATRRHPVRPKLDRPKHVQMDRRLREYDVVQIAKCLGVPIEVMVDTMLNGVDN